MNGLSGQLVMLLLYAFDEWRGFPLDDAVAISH